MSKLATMSRQCRAIVAALMLAPSPTLAQGGPTSTAITPQQWTHDAGGSMSNPGEHVGWQGPSGTTQERNPNPAPGERRWNTTIGCWEDFNPNARTPGGWRCGGGHWTLPGGAFMTDTGGLTGNQITAVIPVPPGAMGPYGCVHLRISGQRPTTGTQSFLGNFSNTRGDITGGAGFMNIGPTSGGTNLTLATPREFCNWQSEGVQVYFEPNNLQSGSGFGGLPPPNSAIDTTVPSYINLTFSTDTGSARNMLRGVSAWLEIP